MSLFTQGAKLTPFKPSQIAFQFIGDSLSAVRLEILLRISAHLFGRVNFYLKVLTKRGHFWLANTSKLNIASMRSPVQLLV